MVFITGIVLTGSGALCMGYLRNFYYYFFWNSVLLIELLLIIWGLTSLVSFLCFGIIGIVNSGKVEKMRSFITVGIVLIVIQVIGYIINVLVYIPMLYTASLDLVFFILYGEWRVSFTASNILISIIVYAFFCVPPTLYIIGGSSRKRLNKTKRLKEKACK